MTAFKKQFVHIVSNIIFTLAFCLMGVFIIPMLAFLLPLLAIWTGAGKLLCALDKLA